MTKPMKALLAVTAAIVCLTGAGAAIAGYYLLSYWQGHNLFNEAYVAMIRHDYETAIVKFSASLRKTLTKTYRAYALSDLAFSENANGRCDDAIRDYTEALRVDPNLAFAYENRGMLYDESGERDKALKDFSEAIQLDPNLYHAFLGRGLIDMERKDLDQAIEDFSEAARIDPSSAAAYNNRGLAYSYKKDFDRALANFDAAIQLRPNYAAALADRGYVYGQKKQFQKAIADLTAGIRLDPNHQPTYRIRGFAFKEDKRWNEAIADFTRALQLDPEDVVSLTGRGSTFAEMGDQDRAIADFTSILQKKQLPDAYYRRGSAYFHKGDFAHANVDLREAVKLAPEDAAALNNLAWFLATCPNPAFRDGKEAVIDATKACEISNWKNAFDIDTLAAACAETGDFDSAVAYEDEALSRDDVNKTKSDEMQNRRALYRHHKPYRQNKTP
jgi:tetratricopeptide (TPR) repeat protein